MSSLANAFRTIVSRRSGQPSTSAPSGSTIVTALSATWTRTRVPLHRGSMIGVRIVATLWGPKAIGRQARWAVLAGESGLVIRALYKEAGRRSVRVAAGMGRSPRPGGLDHLVERRMGGPPAEDVRRARRRRDEDRRIAGPARP